MNKKILFLVLGLRALSLAVFAKAGCSADAFNVAICCGAPQKSISNPICCCCDKRDQRSHSFMYTRPLNQHLEIDEFLWYNIVHRNKGKKKAAFAFTAAYEQSQSSQRVQRYFLPSCNTRVLVAGDAYINDLKTRNIRAEWLGLPDTFRGTFTIDPRQKQFEFVIECNKDLGAVADHSFFDGLWFDIQLPLIFVENNVNLEQSEMITVADSYPSTIVQAFRQPSWMYGKIVNNQARCALAEINVKLGRTYLFDDYFLVSYHSLMRLPTGNHQDPEYLFFPVVGNNGHVGIGAGVDFQLLLTRDVSPFAACFFLSLESTFFIKNNQTRTFDLLGRPWSRYLLLTNIDGPRGNTTPGVNVLTRDVKVHLYNTVDFVMGWRFKTDRYELEFGYSIWGHGNEQLYLRCPFKDVWGIAGCVTDCATDEFIPGPLTPVTASGSTIEFRAPNDEIFIPILESDLDLNSGAAQAAFNNQFHFSAGMIHKGKRMDGCFGVGIFFDFPHYNTSLPMVGGWAKVGSSF